MSRFLRLYEDYFSKTTDAPDDFGHASGLSVLSAISLGRRWIDKGSGPIRPNVYFLLTASSSRDRKSTSVRTATEFIRETEASRLGPDDFTAEGLITHMRVRPGLKSKNKLILSMEEFGQYLATSGRGYGATMSPVLSKLYDGTTFERVRSSQKSITIKNPHLSFIGGVAYGMLEKFADPLEWVTGFFARICWITPTTRRPQFPIQPPKAKVERQLALDALQTLRLELKSTMDQGPMTIDKAAENMYVSYTQDPANDSAKLHDEALIAQRERLNTTIWKTAILYQIDIDPCAAISTVAMDRAITFSNKCWRGFNQVYAKSVGSPFSRLIRRTWKRISDHGKNGIARRDLYKGLHVDIDELFPALELLSKAGIVALAQGEDKKHPIYYALQPFED